MIPTARLVLQFSPQPTPGLKTKALRGALAAAFPEHDLLHQHTSSGFVYRYPLIQYRWQAKRGIIMGFHAGAELLVRLPLLGRALQLERLTTTVTDVDMQFRRQSVEMCETPLAYRFQSPWLPFNQENHAKFQGMSIEDQRLECERIAVGNLLTAFRGLGVHIPDRLSVQFEKQRQVRCRYKDQTFIGFYGTLRVNARLPDGIAIGKAVSHGFGWLAPIHGARQS